MKKSKIITLLLFLSISFLVGFYVTDFAKDEEIQRIIFSDLKVIGEFPKSEENIYTNNILRTIKSENYIYLLEHRAGYILQFDKDGEFIRKISKPGRGPGELINPMDLAYSNGILYTLEQGKMQVQTFDEKGNYLDVFFLHGAYEGMTVFENQILLDNYYYEGMLEYTDMPDLEKYPIFTSVSLNGNNKKSFGLNPRFFNDLGLKTGTTITSVYDNKLYVGYRAFPYVQVYNAEGSLIEEIYLKGGKFENLLKEYKEDIPVQFLNIFMDMEVNNKGIFFSAYGENLDFYQFDFKGNLTSEFSLADYYNSEFRDLYIRNFTIIPDFEREKSRLFLTIQGEYPRTLIVEKKL